MSAASAADVGNLSGFSADPNVAAQQQEQSMQKAAVLKQILTAEALERLGRVKLVKKDKVEALEMKLIQMATRGAEAIQDFLDTRREAASSSNLERNRSRYGRDTTLQAMRGEIQRQLTDDVIVNMLEEAGKEQKAKKVIRRKMDLDDSDNDDDLY